MNLAILVAAALSAPAGPDASSSSVTAPVPADPTSYQPPLPYRAWTVERYPHPTYDLADRAPMPLGEEPELARRMLEFSPDLGVAIPSCGDSGSSCARLLGGAEAGLTALYRISPYFAFGLGARLDAFSLAQEESSESLRGNTTFFGVVARVYGYESGLLDPYLELALGGGALSTESERHGRRSSDRVEFAPAARVAAGLDFALNPWLRLGPTLAFARYAPGAAMHCTSEVCSSLSPSRSAIVSGATSLGFRLTFSAGERL